MKKARVTGHEETIYIDTELHWFYKPKVLKDVEKSLGVTMQTNFVFS